MNISTHIKDLLFDHDCVILPDFGGFVANYVPAAIDYDRNIFGPPAKKISFNSQLIHNDGLLISAVSLTSNLGYKDARNIVMNFVADLNDRLSRGKRVTMEGLGVFFRSKDDTLQFEPDETANFLSHSYGFGSFEFKELEEFDVRKRIQPRKKEISRREQSNRNKMIRRTVIAIPVLVALTLIPLKTNLFKTFTNTGSLGPNNGSNNIERTATESSRDARSSGEDRTDYFVPAVPEPPINEIKEEPAGEVSLDNYFVITGSFKVQENALRMQTRLKKEGYSANIFETETGFYRVALQSYKTYSEAKNALQAYAAVHPHEEYWVLTK